jgi:hypothetical protein
LRIALFRLQNTASSDCRCTISGKLQRFRIVSGPAHPGLAHMTTTFILAAELQLHQLALIKAEVLGYDTMFILSLEV